MLSSYQSRVYIEGTFSQIQCEMNKVITKLSCRIRDNTKLKTMKKGQDTPPTYEKAKKLTEQSVFTCVAKSAFWSVYCACLTSQSGNGWSLGNQGRYEKRSLNIGLRMRNGRFAESWVSGVLYL